jgi:caffeoyl-CoA O-methyltransferase
MPETIDARLLSAIDDYVGRLYAPPDWALSNAIESAHRAGLPAINVSPSEGKLLNLLVGLAGARRVLEIGTLGGYSAIWMARALPPGGRLVSLEIDPRHAEVARNAVEAAGLAEKVEIRVGRALEVMEAMVLAEAPFDLVFIDADKDAYPAYLDASLLLLRPGGLILADNTIRGGDVLAPRDEAARAVAHFNERVAADPRLSGVIVPIMRERIDGLAVIRYLPE